MSSLVMKLAATTAYHPESNSMVEHMHHCLKEALKASLRDCLDGSAALGTLGAEGHHQG